MVGADVCGMETILFDWLLAGWLSKNIESLNYVDGMQDKHFPFENSIWLERSNRDGYIIHEFQAPVLLVTSGSDNSK